MLRKVFFPNVFAALMWWRCYAVASDPENVKLTGSFAYLFSVLAVVDILQAVVDWRAARIAQRSQIE